MPEEHTTADLAMLIQRVVDAVKAGDIGAALGLYAADVVFDNSQMGGAAFEGHAAVREFYTDWRGAYEQYDVELEEVLDLGGGVAFCIAVLRGRLPDSTGWVQFRYATAEMWQDGLAKRVLAYTDIDEGWAAAERLAEERG